MRDHTIDEALVELARTMKALKALRDARKAVPKCGRASNGEPFWTRRLGKLTATASRAAVDCRNKLADLRAGR